MIIDHSLVHPGHVPDMHGVDLLPSGHPPSKINPELVSDKQRLLISWPSQY
jgi:hypothetical protein